MSNVTSCYLQGDWHDSLHNGFRSWRKADKLGPKRPNRFLRSSMANHLIKRFPYTLPQLPLAEFLCRLVAQAARNFIKLIVGDDRVLL